MWVNTGRFIVLFFHHFFLISFFDNIGGMIIVFHDLFQFTLSEISYLITKITSLTN
jgi:hypothetical protein